MESVMRRSLSHFEEATYYCTCIGSARHREAV
jgi:hypothetical protein